MSTEAEMKDELAKLKAENEALKAKNKGGTLSFKVSQKGAISVYGMGRFPVTLYKEQWIKLFERMDDLKEFIKENEGQLTTKD